MIKKPTYITDESIGDLYITYEWDDWRWRQFCAPDDDALFESCFGIERSALIGLLIAEAEWLVFRYEGLSDDPLPLEYLEAAWCANVDRQYSTIVELRDTEWQGPIRRPLQIAVQFIDEALYLVEDWDDPLWQPAWISKLAEHVLSDPRPFQSWRDSCVERLQMYYREKTVASDELFEAEAPVLVPREVFDPMFDFKPDAARELVAHFLQNVDYRTNRFLVDPASMVRGGFRGTPYALP